MSTQPRHVKVFASLLISMTACAMILMALGNNPPSAGAFCLSAYYNLDPAERAISSTITRSSNLWDSVEIYYYSARHQNFEDSDVKEGFRFDPDSKYHFIVGRLNRPGDGRIRPTETWKRQYNLVSGPNHAGAPRTIRICILHDHKANSPTDLQIIRTEALVAGLCRKFDIQPLSVHWPGN